MGVNFGVQSVECNTERQRESAWNVNVVLDLGSLRIRLVPSIMNRCFSNSQGSYQDSSWDAVDK
jgi:hypothetical protein